MVGSRFCELYQDRLIKTDFKGKISIYITKSNQVDYFFKRNSFEWLILFSAFTDVDAAEKQREDKKGTCWQINVNGAKNIVKACKKYKRKLIFISTDFVFDGSNGPYSENDATGPDLNKVSWYGITKIESEKIIQESLSDFIILRIAYPYRAKFLAKDDIAKRILRFYGSGELYPMFYDQKITPTFIDDIPKAIELLIADNRNGIFHLASPELTTQYEFAKYLIDLFEGDSKNLRKTSAKKFLKNPAATPRPVSGGLKVEKIRKIGFIPTNWKIGLEAIYEQSKGQLI